MKRSTTLRLVALCAFVYFTSYITRLDYAACLNAIERDMAISRSAVSAAVTGSFITYGLGQLVSGVLGDRFSPYKIIAVGLVGTGLTNLSVFFLRDIGVIAAVWCFNGFFQSLLWPPMVRILAERLSPAAYTRAVTVVTVASAVATTVIYLVASLCIKTVGWRYVFLVALAFSIAATVLWSLFARKGIPSAPSEATAPPSPLGEEIAPAEGDRTAAASPSAPAAVPSAFSAPERAQIAPEGQRSALRLLAISGLLPVVFAIALQGILRDGITTWMPTYITDVNGLGVSSAALTTAILPVLSALSIAGSGLLQRKMNNELLSAILLFGAAAVLSLVLALCYPAGAATSVALLSLTCACMHGTNFFLIGQLPSRFAKTGKASTFSGILNSATYVGAAISAYGFAALSERFGWNLITYLWAGCAALGAAICLFSLAKWKKYQAAATEKGAPKEGADSEK